MSAPAVLREVSRLLRELRELKVLDTYIFDFELGGEETASSGGGDGAVSAFLGRLSLLRPDPGHQSSKLDCGADEADGDSPALGESFSKVVYRCRRCRRQFATGDLLEHHERGVHGDDRVRARTPGGRKGGVPFRCCQICNKCFKAKEELIRHNCKLLSGLRAGFIEDLALLKSHNMFVCGQCGEAFRLFDRISSHLAKCKVSADQSLACELCRETFAGKKLLDKHKEESHKDELAFRCAECPRVFKLRNSLRKHVAMAHGTKTRLESCRQQRFQCPERGCGKVFVKRVYLTVHMTRFHNLAKPYLCQTCGDTFVSASSLKSHQAIHTGERPFPCETCGKTFRRKDKLKLHEAIHSNERPHKCPVCEKGFISNSKLKDHMQRHTGYKRFSCQVCRKLYSGSYDLRKHLLRHHPGQSANIKPMLPLTPQIVKLIDEQKRPAKVAATTTTPKRSKNNKNEGPAATATIEQTATVANDYGDLEIDLNALNAAEVPIEELEVNALLTTAAAEQLY